MLRSALINAIVIIGFSTSSSTLVLVVVRISANENIKVLIRNGNLNR